MHCPPRTFRPILRSIGLLDIKIPRKEIIFTDDRRTDRRTDGRTDRRRVEVVGSTEARTALHRAVGYGFESTTTIGSFFEKRKKY